MFCKNCGNKLEEGTNFCGHCGASCLPAQNVTQNSGQNQQENSVWGVLAIVFGALGGSLGFVFAVVGLCIYKEDRNRRNAWIGLALSIMWTVLAVIFVIVFYVAWFPQLMEWIESHGGTMS